MCAQKIYCDSNTGKIKKEKLLRCIKQDRSGQYEDIISTNNKECRGRCSSKHIGLSI